MREVPYCTTDDESQWIGHIWRQRQYIGGPWGYCYEVHAPFDRSPCVCGWRSTQEQAEQAMRLALKEKSGESLDNPQAS